jgi:hypothetical protein
VIQNFQKEALSISLEKWQRILNNLDLFSPFKEFNCAQVDFVKLHSFRGIGTFAQKQGLLINSTHGLNNFFLSEKLKNANARPDA